MSLHNRLLVVLCITTVSLSAQMASYMEGGMMNCRLKDSGMYQSNWIPGFSIAVSGLEISMYAGRFPMKEFPDSLKTEVNGGFWNIGYLWRSNPRERLKRFQISMGIGIGGYGIKEMNGVQVNLRPGLQINLTRTISLSASLYAGYNFMGANRDTTLTWSNNGYLSTQRWFVNPSLTLRLNTNPMAVMGDWEDRSEYWGGGMVKHRYSTEDGDYETTSYLPAGDYVTDAIMTSTNYVNLYPKMMVGTMLNYKGNSLAFGGGIAVRAGLLALDVEYIQGKIGFHQDQNGVPTDQWKMRRTCVSVGINWFNIPFPLRGPSVIRVITGGRFGKTTLESMRDELIPGTPNPENGKGKVYTPYLGLEFGTLGITMDFFWGPNGYKSGMVLGATYLIPLYDRS
jgi:hypothetical protein